MRVERELFSSILRQLETYGYREDLEAVSVVLDRGLWLVGGWLRSAFLGQAGYAGDLDCLSLLSSQQIISRLIAASIPFSRNSHQGFRIQLCDRNHIDIIYADQKTSAGTIEGALDAFNFSVNSAAFRIHDGAFECSRDFLDDIQSREFQLNDGHVSKPQQRKVLLKDAETLLYHYQLKPKIHKPTSDLIREIANEKSSLSQLTPGEGFERAREATTEILGNGVNAWIVRGYPRCSILGGLQYWDDLDVVLESSKHDTCTRIHQNGYEYTENYWGNPKVCLRDGSTIDVWSLPEGQTIEDELARYSHNLDAIAWNRDSGALIDPFQIRTDPTVEIIEEHFRALSREDVAYASLKTAYLCLRHKLLPGPKARELMLQPLHANGFVRSNAARLAKELACASGGRTLDLSPTMSDLRTSPALEELLKFAHT